MAAAGCRNWTTPPKNSLILGPLQSQEEEEKCRKTSEEEREEGDQEQGKEVGRQVAVAS